MLLIVLLAALAGTAIIATVRVVVIDGYRALPVDRLRLPSAPDPQG